MDANRIIEPGVLHGLFDDDEPECKELDEMRKATPKAGDISDAFVNLPTELAAPDARTVYVVHEIRVIYGKTQRRVIGVHDSEQAAERQAEDVRHVLRRFLEQYNGRPFQDEMCGGTLVQYWHAGNPLRIVGFAVYVEAAKLQETSNVSRRETTDGIGK